MSTTLEQYYATNYTKCNLPYNILATWQAVAYPIHIIQFFSLPFQVLAFYIIMTKTPPRMKPLQLPLFLNHLFGGLLDVCFCSFSTLFFFEPMMAFATVGVFNWLGLSFVYQGVLGAAMASGVAGSYVFLFESRSSSLLENRFRIHRKSSSFLYYTYFFAPYIAVLVAIYNVAEESDAAKLRALEVYPCPTPEFFMFSVCVFVGNPSNMFLIFAFLLLQATGNIIFHVACLVYYLYVAPPSTLSQATKRDQRTFLISVSIQTSIPLFVIIAPAMAVLLASWTGTYRQEWMNLSNVCIATHGLAESISIMLVHKPYRAAIRRILGTGNTIANHRSVELY
ncbi:Serpentine Receptor, class H [Caenorhabditis elegans]|uniref:Serpentine Receptor, class H n=1 Tax=Caenorhabditis elegans TaxID=6239 RepID=O45795_CAEEL|nr:Serpentine Receptor, class H [Caenorhabditis elegans]CAB07489.2 Serpentine Receptor, class H [Caenorhabditis elegans]|eukprot:NP_507361.2 Serpentine Receptor, class H [Caenorhabditis elegans]